MTSSLDPRLLTAQVLRAREIIANASKVPPPEDCVWRPDVEGLFCPSTELTIIERDDVHPVAPLWVDLAITLRCQGGCPFCYMDATPHGPHAPLRVIHELAEVLRPFPPFTIALGGGEPTLHPQLPEVVRILRQCTYITLSTGRKRDIRMLERVLPDVLKVGVSIGEVEETMAALRLCGKKAVLHIPLFQGEYEAAMRVLDRVAEEGVEISGILILSPNPVGRGQSVGRPPKEWLAVAIVNLVARARSLGLFVWGNPCWTNRARIVPPIADMGCNGGWGSMHYNAVTQTCSRCSYLHNEEEVVPPSQMLSWWKRQKAVTDCPLEIDW